VRHAFDDGNDSASIGASMAGCRAMQIARRSTAALAAAAVALGLAACGDERTVTTEPEAQATTTEAQTPPPPPAASGAVPAVGKDLAKKPKIPKPAGTPPAKLIVKDIVKGTGKALKEGDTATVQYVGASWSTGAEFDASWDRGAPATFPVAQGSLIQGWVDGLQGMKVGGRRELVIPPNLGYGPQGSPPSIAPNETLVFVIDLKKLG
jgi:peptidylprolyl isomerase